MKLNTERLDAPRLRWDKISLFLSVLSGVSPGSVFLLNQSRSKNSLRPPGLLLAVSGSDFDSDSGSDSD